MDTKNSYHLLAMMRKLIICLAMIFSINQELKAENQPNSGADSQEQTYPFKEENTQLLRQLDSQGQVIDALKYENLILGRENLNKELSIENRNFFIFTVLLFSFVALFLAYMLYRSIQKASLNNDKLKQQNKEIDQQKKELEELNRLKIKFLSIISHDIRSPLLSLKGVLNLFDGGLLRDKTELNKFFMQLNEEFITTSSLLDNLLIWAKKQMYEESVEKVIFPINKVVNDNLNLQKAAIVKRNIKVFNLLTDDLFVYADREMINMVIRNLLGNALKFTHHGGQISIFYKTSSDFLEVGIRDTGIGISAEQVDKIFDSSFYSTAGLNHEKGNGLGLMLCREFIDKSNGKLWIESEIGAGSTFFFTLPLIKNNDGNIPTYPAAISATTDSFIR
jgi:two-component system sensor histidine kinase/response regulator